MIIQEEVLVKHGAVLHEYQTHDLIFEEGTTPHYYYQIVKGRVKISNYNEDGTEFIHNIQSHGQCVGEWMLFSQHTYPMSAVAMCPSSVLCLSKPNFEELLKDHPELSIKLLKCTSDKMYFKFIMSHNNVVKSPVCKIWFFISYLKSYHYSSKPFSYEVRLTRQQIANYTGLTVETVIRSIKHLEGENKLIIKNGKIFL